MLRTHALMAMAATFMLHATLAGASEIDALIENCVGCHGPDGVSQHADMPTIAGVSEPVHEDAMFSYQDSARPCTESDYRHGDKSRAATDMCKIAAAMSEDQIIEVAAHFAGKPFAAMKQASDPAKAKAGEALHERDCSRCHSAGGSDAADDAGIIAGQPMGYLKSTFVALRAGEREQPKKMQAKLDELSDADVEALIHFYASQQ